MKIIIKITLVMMMLSSASFAMMSDNPLITTLNINKFEKQFANEEAMKWDGYMRVGYDMQKVYLYSEGEKHKNSKSESENQLIYSHTIAPYWDMQVGYGLDIGKDNNYNWGVIAFSGLAPYFFKTRVALLIGENGALGTRLDVEYEALLTQKLILSPSIKAALYSKDIPTMELGKGLSDITFGLRLRYEISRKFAPYIGVEWTKNYDNTNKFNRPDESYLSLGLKFWF